MCFSPNFIKHPPVWGLWNLGNLGSTMLYPYFGMINTHKNTMNPPQLSPVGCLVLGHWLVRIPGLCLRWRPASWCAGQLGRSARRTPGAAGECSSAAAGKTRKSELQSDMDMFRMRVKDFSVAPRVVMGGCPWRDLGIPGMRSVLFFSSTFAPWTLKISSGPL